MGGKTLPKNTPRCGGLAIGASRWGLRRWDFALAPPVLLVMCFASGALAPAARGRRDGCSGCFDALDFTELRCFLSTEIFGLGDAFKGVSGIGHFCAEKEGEKNLTLSNKNVLTAFCFAETWEGFCLFSSVQQKGRLKTSKLVTKWNIHPQPTPRVWL